MIRRLLHHNFRLVTSVDFWIRRRFSPSGLLALSVLVVSAVIGVDTNQTTSYQIFALVSALLIISVIWSSSFRGRFAVGRRLPRFGTVGAPLSYRIVVKNHGRTAQRDLSLFDDLERSFPSAEEFGRAEDSADKRFNWFDRAVGFRRWQRLITRNAGAIVQEHPLPVLRAGEAADIRLEILPLRRGVLKFTGVTIARPDPFGLFKSFVRVAARQSVVILPRRYPVAPIALAGSRHYQRGGVALASEVGDSEEFVSVREYRPGDPLRRLHWKSWAKTGKPFVKEYQDEFFIRHALILDTFTNREPSERFEEAVSVAASIVCSLKIGDSLLDLLFVGPEAYCFTSGRGLAHTDRMLEILACVRPCRDKPFSTLDPLVLPRASSLSGCVCIFLAWDEERRHFVDRLRVLRVPLRVVVVTDRGTGGILEPGPMSHSPKSFHTLEVGKIAEGLATL